MFDHCCHFDRLAVIHFYLAEHKSEKPKIDFLRLLSNVRGKGGLPCHVTRRGAANGF